MNVLAVCTGNICRSPAMARALSAVLDDTVDVTSAGTHAVVDSPIDPTTAALLAASGREATGFRARQLDAAMVQGADLVLTATAAHRRQVLALAPAALRRTFTLREFAHLVQGVRADAAGDRGDSDDATRLRALLAAAPARRAAVTPGAPLDIDDPHGSDRAAQVRALGEIDACVDVLVESLRPRRRPG